VRAFVSYGFSAETGCFTTTSEETLVLTFGVKVRLIRHIYPKLGRFFAQADIFYVLDRFTISRFSGLVIDLQKITGDSRVVRLKEIGSGF
jgi:hypothetical protein